MGEVSGVPTLVAAAYRRWNHVGALSPLTGEATKWLRWLLERYQVPAVIQAIENADRLGYFDEECIEDFLMIQVILRPAEVLLPGSERWPATKPEPATDEPVTICVADAVSR
jgi:hypothetical protein